MTTIETHPNDALTSLLDSAEKLVVDCQIRSIKNTTNLTISNVINTAVAFSYGHPTPIFCTAAALVGGGLLVASAAINPATPDGVLGSEPSETTRVRFANRAPALAYAATGLSCFTMAQAIPGNNRDVMDQTVNFIETGYGAGCLALAAVFAVTAAKTNRTLTRVQNAITRRFDSNRTASFS